MPFFLAKTWENSLTFDASLRELPQRNESDEQSYLLHTHRIEAADPPCLSTLQTSENSDMPYRVMAHSNKFEKVEPATTVLDISY